MDNRFVSTWGVVAIGLAWVVSACSLSSAKGGVDPAAPNALCSPAGVAARVAGLELVEGRGLSVPDPTDAEQLDAFWRVHNSLMATIEMEVARRNVEWDPVAIAQKGTGRGPVMPPYWRSTELGVGTNGDQMLCPESRGVLGGEECAASNVGSFLNRLEPVANVGDARDGSSFYWKVVNDDPAFGEPRYGSLVYVEPTVHPCVSKMLLAEATSVGTWLPGWVLHDEAGAPFLIVDNCVDLYDAYGTEFVPVASGPSRRPKPAVAFFAAIQQPCPTKAQCCRGPGKPCFE